MSNERRLIKFIRENIEPVIADDETLTLVALDVKLETLDKLLALLPTYNNDVAFDAICGKEKEEETNEP